jgi:hypothetical protein
MLQAVRVFPLENTFFKDRYFPTDEASDIFGTSRVLADFKDDNQKIAPFVLPRIGSIPGTRSGFSTAELEPANIAISMPLTLDQLRQRGFGESLLSNATPEDRARHFLMRDLDDLSVRISRAEELLAINTMLTNGTTMRHRTDSADLYEDVGAFFYDGDNNPALFTPSAAWAHSTYANGTWTPGNWYHDICAMIQMLTKYGRPAREILVSQDVSDFLLADGWVLAMLDNRRVEMGNISPSELTAFEYTIGSFNFNGRVMPIIASTATYENEAGVDTLYLPNGTVIVTAPACGRGLYGAVSQIEKDEQVHTYAGRRIPQHIATVRPPALETQLTARPLFVPNRPNPWSVAKNVFTPTA